jgi:transcriptional regulator with XRE-family HTH domain
MPMDIVLEIGKTIRKQREKLGLSMEETAHLSGISTNQLGAIERAESVAKIDTFFNITKALGINWTQMFNKNGVNEDDNQMSSLVNNFDTKDTKLFNAFVKEFTLWKAEK